MSVNFTSLCILTLMKIYMIMKFVYFQPKLTMARCRRNVDNFLEACRKIGVEEVSFVLCHFNYYNRSKQHIGISTLVFLFKKSKYVDMLFVFFFIIYYSFKIKV